MALFASIEYGDFSSPMHSDPIFLIKLFLIGSVLSAAILIKLALNLIKNPNPGIAAKTVIQSSLWFWLFSLTIIIDVVLRISGAELYGINLLG